MGVLTSIEKWSIMKIAYQNDNQNPLPPKRTFTQEQKHALINFARILKQIHIRLVIEGYTIKDGKITPPKKEDDSLDKNTLN